MQKLGQGIHHFPANVFRPRREWFERLADGQRSPAPFLTCSNSRASTHVIPQTGPGELFIIHNAGYITPPRSPPAPRADRPRHLTRAARQRRG